MKRTAGAMMLLAALGGCISTEHKPSMDSNNPGGGNGHLTIPNAVGPWGQPVSYNPSAARPGAAPAPADGVVTAGYGGIDNLKGTGTENGLVKVNYNAP